MTEMKIDIKYIKKGLDQNLKEHRELRNDQKSLISKLDDFIEAIDTKLDKKADKKTVDILYGRIWKVAIGLIIILLGVIGFLLRYDLYLLLLFSVPF